MLSVKIMYRDPIDPDLGREKALRHLQTLISQPRSTNSGQSKKLDDIDQNKTHDIFSGSHTRQDIPLPDSASEIDLRSRLILQRLQSCLQFDPYKEIHQEMDHHIEIGHEDYSEALEKIKKARIYSIPCLTRPSKKFATLKEVSEFGAKNSLYSKLAGYPEIAFSKNTNYLPSNFTDLDPDLIQKFYSIIL